MDSVTEDKSLLKRTREPQHQFAYLRIIYRSRSDINKQLKLSRFHFLLQRLRQAEEQ